MNTTEEKTTDQQKAVKTCNCLNDIKEKLKAHHGSEITLELQGFLLMDPNANTWEVSAGLPPLYYKHKVGGKWKRSYVRFLFCPFCGKPTKAAALP